MQDQSLKNQNSDTRKRLKHHSAVLSPNAYINTKSGVEKLCKSRQ